MKVCAQKIAAEAGIHHWGDVAEIHNFHYVNPTTLQSLYFCTHHFAFHLQRKPGLPQTPKIIYSADPDWITPQQLQINLPLFYQTQNSFPKLVQINPEKQNNLPNFLGRGKQIFDLNQHAIQSQNYPRTSMKKIIKQKKKRIKDRSLTTPQNANSNLNPIPNPKHNLWSKPTNHPPTANGKCEKIPTEKSKFIEFTSEICSLHQCSPIPTKDPIQIPKIIWLRSDSTIVHLFPCRVLSEFAVFSYLAIFFKKL